MPDVRRPVRVNVNVTRRCNLTCWYCHSSSGPSYRGPELSAQAWRSVVEGAEKLGVFEITLTGGEPLMWSHLKEAMAASQDLDWTSLEILSNAMVLGPRRLAALRSGKVARVCVSLDGVAEVHEANRGAGSFDKVLDGIARLRDVVDNITVISVVDASNADRWPELTYQLAERGVRQHHLSPVCFAGHAMDDYRGLSAEQFCETRARVDSMADELPEGFVLRFNDELLHPPSGRCTSISNLVEVVKGLHLQVMPDGAVRSAVRAWGRSWRRDETLGNLDETPLAELVQQSEHRRATHYATRFPLEDEVRDKFHLGADPASVQADIEAVQASETGRPGHLRLLSHPARPSLLDDSERLRADVAGFNAAATRVLLDAGRLRLRIEPDVGMLFDTTTFDVTLLTAAEAMGFEALSTVPTRWVP